MKRDAICGTIGGIVLSLPLNFSYLMSLLSNITAIIIMFGLCVMIVPLVLLFKNSSGGHALVRAIIMFISCFVFTRVLVITGVLQKIGGLFHIYGMDRDNPAAGLPLVLILIVMFGECIITSIVLLMIFLIKRAKKHSPDVFEKSVKTGDGSALTD